MYGSVWLQLGLRGTSEEDGGEDMERKKGQRDQRWEVYGKM